MKEEDHDEISCFLQTEKTHNNRKMSYSQKVQLSLIVLFICVYFFQECFFFLFSDLPFNKENSLYFPQFYLLYSDIFNHPTKLLEFTFSFFFFFLFLLSLFLTVLTNPGNIPEEDFWNLNLTVTENLQCNFENLAICLLEKEEFLEKISQKASSSTLKEHVIFEREEGHLRFCQYCMKFQPDRAYHCKTCGKCILKMDHHCYFLGCCIGFFNYKFYLTLLFYGTFFYGFYLLNFMKIFLDSVMEIEFITIKEDWESKLFCLFYILGMVEFLHLACLLVFNWVLIGKNLTDLEYKERKQNSKNFYELGSFWENYKEVMGENPFLWLVPLNLKDDSKNGTYFKVNIINNS